MSRAPSAFQVRLAGPADVDAFVLQRVAIFAETQGLEPGPRREAFERSTRAAYQDLVPRAAALVWLAEDATGAAIGSCALHRLDRFPSLSNPVAFEGYVSHVWVTPAWRRRGVGSALVKALAAEARARGFTRVRLHATEEGRALYATLGFRLRSNDMELVL